MGAQSRAVADRIAGSIKGGGHSVSLEGINYPQDNSSIFDFLMKNWLKPQDAIDNLVNEGALVSALVNRRHGECPNSKIALVAYSEGAWIVHSGATALMPMVNVTILLADPMHQPDATYNRDPFNQHGGGIFIGSSPSDPIQAGPGARVGSYCLNGDLVCEGLNPNPFALAGAIGRHGEYSANSDGVADAAAGFATFWLSHDLHT
jgi:hypothetical protein